MITKQAKYDAKKRAEASERGLKERRFYVHPDDTQRVRAFVERLNKQREREG